MNRTASVTIAAVKQVLTFFFSFWTTAPCAYVFVSQLFIIQSESGDKSNVTYNWVRKKSDSQKGVRTAADSQKRVPRGKKFGNLCARVTSLRSGNLLCSFFAVVLALAQN